MAAGGTRCGPRSAAECARAVGMPGRPSSRGPRLWATAVTFALAGLAAYAVVINLVPLLRERGESLTTAGLLLGLGGIGQVVGRVGFLSLATRSSLRIRTVATLAAMAATTALLGLLTGLLLLAAVVVVVVAGMARGMFTLLQATAVTDRWGHPSLRPSHGTARRADHAGHRPGAVVRGPAGPAAGQLLGGVPRAGSPRWSRPAPGPDHPDAEPTRAFEGRTCACLRCAHRRVTHAPAVSPGSTVGPAPQSRCAGAAPSLADSVAVRAQGA